MAISVRPSGRPIMAAIIGTPDDDDMKLYDLFFNVCRALTCSDITALSHGLGLTVRTVRNWHYGLNFPKEKSTAKAVIDWYTKGKPVKKILQCESLQTLL